MMGMPSARACESLVCSTWPALVHVMTKEGRLAKQVDLGSDPTLADVHQTFGNISELQSHSLSKWRQVAVNSWKLLVVMTWEPLELLGVEASM